MPFIDINCDLGEGFGNYSSSKDHLLLDYISSANIACGFHAGDWQVMEQTVKLAQRKGVAIGAHPGLPDLQGFGRREMNISAKEAYQMTLYQIGALHGFVKAAGAALHHVKPHGALYNMAAKNGHLAEAISRAVFDFNSDLILYGLSGSELIKQAKNMGLKTASEVFADRTYQDDGSLTSRCESKALIHNAEESVKQVLMMIEHSQVVSVDNKLVPLQADTLCIHGDGAHAVEFARLIFNTLKDKSIEIRAMS